jgi:hypothetical protein
MNELNIEQAVAALVNHYVAASAGLVDENVEASYGYQKFALLFNYGAEKGIDRASGDFVEARKCSGKVSKDKDCLDEAPDCELKKGAEPLNAFFAFARERKEGIASEAAALSAPGNVHASTAQKLNEMWAALPGNEKEKYMSECVSSSLRLCAFRRTFFPLLLFLLICPSILRKPAKVQRKALVSSAVGALQSPHAPSIFETSASSYRGDVPLGTIGLTGTIFILNPIFRSPLIASCSDR